MTSMDLTGWTWLNEPQKWSPTPLTVHADPGSDLWRLTGNGITRDNGHLYALSLTGDFTITATFTGEYAAQYDQAGVGLLADGETWIKAGVELFDGELRASTVVTRGFSDWNVARVEPFERFTVSAERSGDAVWVRYGTDGQEPVTLLRQAYFPPDVEVRVGIMAASPEGEGFVTQFHEVQLTR
ncbi:DUF1349 domain-containing protein [Lentzea flaviverrucosa]|nr:DUF1349 domain-containing protein [Lentzea flaviverrucosa]